MPQQSTMTPQQARKTLWIILGIAATILLVISISLVFGLVHPVKHRVLVMLMLSVFGPAPVTFLLSKTRFRGLFESDASAETASIKSAFRRKPSLLIVLPLVTMAVIWGLLLRVIGMKKDGNTQVWVKEHSVLVVFWMMVPQVVTAYLCILLNAKYIGMYIAASIIYMTVRTAISGLELENGVVKFFGTYKAHASPLVILSLAVICCGSYAVLHFAVWSMWPSQYINMHGMEDALYFSVVTMATVGYGDILPAGHAARWLCIAEIVSGVLLLVVGVSASMTIWLQNNQPSQVGRSDLLVNAPTMEEGIPSKTDGLPWIQSRAYSPNATDVHIIPSNSIAPSGTSS